LRIEKGYCSAEFIKMIKKVAKCKMQKAEQTIAKIAQSGNKFKQKPNLSDSAK